MKSSYLPGVGVVFLEICFVLFVLFSMLQYLSFTVALQELITAFTSSESRAETLVLKMNISRGCLSTYPEDMTIKLLMVWSLSQPRMYFYTFKCQHFWKILRNFLLLAFLHPMPSGLVRADKSSRRKELGSLHHCTHSFAFLTWAYRTIRK